MVVQEGEATPFYSPMKERSPYGTIGKKTHQGQISYNGVYEGVGIWERAPMRERDEDFTQ